MTKNPRMLTYLFSATMLLTLAASSALAAPVPGYVPPVSSTQTPFYADDTRGVYVPQHTSYRLKNQAELNNWQQGAESGRPVYAQSQPGAQQYENKLNSISSGVNNLDAELDRIAQNPGLLQGGAPSQDAHLYSLDGRQLAQTAPQPQQPNLLNFPSLANGGQARAFQQQQFSNGGRPAPQIGGQGAGIPTADGGLEIAGGLPVSVGRNTLDMHNSIVRLQEERISVRRALQRMMDQIGGGNWNIVWDVAEQNAGLPEMEISVYAEEPFSNVLNALLARLQTRSGQPLRVIRYDNTQRIVITDRTGGTPKSTTSPIGVDNHNVAITENVLKEAVVSLHFDEIPLVDALENIVQQAGKGQWRLRMYAGLDQVLKPAHIEEPFNIAIERLLKVFGLKYEIFPGGKLIVVTHSNKFGFRGVQ